MHVYKDPAEIPEEIYSRVGTAKPGRGFPASVDGQVFTSKELERLATPLSIQVEQAADASDTAQLQNYPKSMMKNSFATKINLAW